MNSIKFNNGKTIVGIGSALVDILINENDSYLEKMKSEKGGMYLVDNQFVEDALSRVSGKPCVVPGGSACNTVIGVANLGGAARFVGKRGQDELGNFFQEDLEKNNVEPMLFSSPTPTGKVLSVITPDAQRTMFTYLGASEETSPEEITGICFTETAIVHIEGYLLFNRDLMLSALTGAKNAGALVSLDLASFTVVEGARDFLEKIVSDYVDILVANEDEARAFTGHTDEEKAIDALSGHAEIAVLKVGKRGSYITAAGSTIRIKPHGAGSAIDTTGAGDLWAAGFLFGIVNGFPLEKCGELGSACGYEVCQVVGANISEDGWQRIRKML